MSSLTSLFNSLFLHQKEEIEEDKVKLGEEGLVTLSGSWQEEWPVHHAISLFDYLMTCYESNIMKVDYHSGLGQAHYFCYPVEPVLSSSSSHYVKLIMARWVDKLTDKLLTKGFDNQAWVYITMPFEATLPITYVWWTKCASGVIFLQILNSRAG